MSENSKIEWTDHTFSPWMGCTKISPGCDNCYAEAMMDTRLHKVRWGPRGQRIRTSAANWREPVRWNARHEEFFAAHGRRQRVFCASLADVFDNAVPAAWRRDLAALIEATPALDWQLLTKRIGNAAAMLVDMFPAGTPDHVWLGATVVNQTEADRDVPKLLATPARVRFLSIEPMLGPIDLLWPETLWPDGPTRCCSGHECGCGGQPIDPWLIYGVNWVIAGGESGPGARPAHPDWFRSLRDQCAEAHVAFFFKQWGQWAPGSNFPEDVPIPSGERAYFDGQDMDDNESVWNVGKRAAGRLLDGRTHDEFPENTR
ncbi:phage Gp37/Gp68 family protein [Burkholderia gladioli]|uniref:phage Gp37/Gp68 family protein n=1 Tax=Burkholderia gladioli TaxID=28095 RepID=UPI001641EBC4|nr:phage Gp37/Gp68 family protein [Burkholderia gladioli]MBJ9658948.1 phage Gp37/Gp68 family protein [Burkholderia gladioli]